MEGYGIRDEDDTSISIGKVSNKFGRSVVQGRDVFGKKPTTEYVPFSVSGVVPGVRDVSDRVMERTPFCQEKKE